MAVKKKLKLRENQLITFEEARANFILRCKAKNLSERTIDWYQLNLRLLKEFLEENGLPTTPAMIEPDHIREYIAEMLEEELSPKTINGRIRTYHVFFQHLQDNGLLEHNIMKEIDKVKEGQTLIKTFTEEQLKRILEQPNRETFAGLRDYTIMLTFFDTGIRLSGLLNLKVKDVNLDSGYLTVVEKGNKERIVPMGERLSKALKEYLESVELEPEDYLFCSVYENKLDKRTLQENIKEYGIKAGITDVRVSPHTFRHTFAKFYLMNGGNIFELQKILGHTSLEMVRKYVNLFDEDIKQQHKKYSPLDNILPANKKRKKLS